MEMYQVIPTSRDSADCESIVLWQSDQRRLVFKPTLINNPQDDEAALRGDLVYQRKRQTEEWEDNNELPLNRLKAGDGVKITLHARELLILIRHIAALYRFHATSGLPRRRVHLLKVDLEDEDAETLQRLDISKLTALKRRAGIDVIDQLLTWMVDQEHAALAVEHLSRLDGEALQRLSALAGLAAMEDLISLWESNSTNGSEEYWQKTFARNAFVLSQAFSFPVVIIKAKAYVGGKSLENTGGHLADYLCANPVTLNPVIIEIKPPTTPLLLGRKYRDDVYALSEDLSGAVTQVLNYRLNLVSDPRLTRGFEHQVEVFSPRCMVLIGNAERLSSPDERRSFELARGALRDVDIVTYDELFAKLRSLVAALKS